jgi:hypothetical protein
MKRYFYSDTINAFINASPSEILGSIVQNSEFADEVTQKNAWLKQIEIL